MRSLLANLPIGRKFFVIGLLAVAMAALPLWRAVADTWERLQAARTEATGLAPAGAVLQWVRLSQQHRGLSGLALNGDAVAADRRQAKQAEIDRALDLARQSLATLGASDLDRELTEVQAAWRTVATAVAGRTVSAAESFSRQTALIDRQLALLDGVLDASTLVLDPEAGPYYLVTAALIQLPQLSESLGQMRARGSLVLGAAPATPEQRVQVASLSAMARQNLRRARGALEKALAADATIRDALKGHTERAHAAAEAVLTLTDQQVVEARAGSLSASDYFTQVTQAIDAQFALTDEARGALDTALTTRVRQAWNTLWWTVGFFLVLGVVALWIMRMTARITITGLQEAVRVAQCVAAGDLRAQVPVTSRDEIGQLLLALKVMNDNLRGIVSQVRLSSDSIATGSAQIAVGNADLSQRTEEQAANLQQTAASMEQLTATVKQNADTAAKASTLAQAASQAAHQGGDSVGAVVLTMQQVSDSSRKIVDIIGVIDSIAFQTNILALNAAVEAARAGEQGRGFAVVAAEVRGLAQRSAQAARDIKALIGSSVGEIEASARMAHQAGQAVRDIVGQVEGVTTLITAISAASHEQTMGISQVGDAVTQLDHVTQQNAALVEESAAAADSLKQQAARLAHMVGSFQLETAALTA